MGLIKRDKIWHWNFYYKGRQHFGSTRTNNKQLAEKLFSSTKEKIINQVEYNVSGESIY